MGKQPEIYADLAAWARTRGYPRVTASVVQQWVHRGLMPRAERAYSGFGAYRTILAAGAGAQLLALCRYRYDWGVGRSATLQALLWLDGFDVPTAGLREEQVGVIGRGLARAIERQMAEAEREPPGSRPEEWESVASALAGWSPLRNLLRGLPETDRLAVVEEIGLLGGRGEPLTDFAVQALEQALGARLPRGRLRPVVRAVRATLPRSRARVPEEELLAVRAAWPPARDAALEDLGASDPGFHAWRDLAAFEVELFWSLVALDRALAGSIGA